MNNSLLADSGMITDLIFFLLLFFFSFFKKMNKRNYISDSRNCSAEQAGTSSCETAAVASHTWKNNFMNKNILMLSLDRKLM